MDIEIMCERGGPGAIELCNWDPAFMRRIFEWLGRQHTQGNYVGAGDGFHILTAGQQALVAAVEEILGEPQEELTITLKITGRPITP